MQRKIQIGEVVERSKKLEAMLKNLQAEGRGLHELVSSIQDKLDQELSNKLRFIATIRNNAIHNPEFDIGADIERFNSACDEAETELNKLIKPERKKRAAKKKNNNPKFNHLFLLPFIPGAHIIYFAFILVLSIIGSSRYIIMLAFYPPAFFAIIQGVVENNMVKIWTGAGIFTVLYVCGMFLPPKRFPGFRYIPFLNIAGILSRLKNKIRWRLFFIAAIFIILTILSGIAIFSWRQYLLGVFLFFLAYLGGIVFFLYVGRKKQAGTDKYGRIQRK
ncbi:MAG: hypothetical protein WCS27_17010 [Victivallaceae bacterium]